MSLRGSAWPSVTTSGAMYSGVPSTAFAVVSPESSVARAKPKSHSRTSSCGSRTAQHVRRFDVAVDDARAVRRRQRAAQLAGQKAQLSRLQPPFARQPVGQIAARVVVHHQEQLPVAVDDVLNREHVRMGDAAHDLDLAPEALDDRRALAQVRVDDLEGDLRARLLVARPHDLGDRAPPHGGEHAIAARQQLGKAGTSTPRPSPVDLRTSGTQRMYAERRHGRSGC